MMKYFILSLILACSFTLQGQNEHIFPTASPSSVGISSEILKQMDESLHEIVDRDSLAGIQTAILKDGKLIHFDSYGYANIETKVKLDEKSIFRIFSMTKPIVSVALMQLVENGSVNLNDPLDKFIPAFRNMQVIANGEVKEAVNKIRIIDLLRHSSGLGNGRSGNNEIDAMYREASLNDAVDNREYAEKVAELPLYFEPGTDWMYSISTNIIGAVVEVASGRPLDKYLRENILDPLEMNDTYFELSEEKVEHFTVGYRWDSASGLVISEDQKNNRYTKEVTLFKGGGGLVSTTLDYLKFCSMLINRGVSNNHQILKPESVDLMTSDQMAKIASENEEVTMPRGETGFGLGFAVNDTIPGRKKGIYGWGGAVGTYFRIDQDNHMAYIMMIQLSPYRQLGLRELFQGFVLDSLVD